MSKHMKTCKAYKKVKEREEKAKKDKCRRIENPEEEYDEYDESKIYPGGVLVQRVVEKYQVMSGINLTTRRQYKGFLRKHIIPWLEVNYKWRDGNFMVDLACFGLEAVTVLPSLLPWANGEGNNTIHAVKTGISALKNMCHALRAHINKR